MLRFHTELCRPATLPIAAVDLGYSARSRSCGLMYPDLQEPRSLTFGDCVREVCTWVKLHGDVILVLEGVLSTYHQPNGNPDIRGSFEKGMGWYYGPGAVTVLAARRFLTQMEQMVQQNVRVCLVEAFVSFKRKGRTHTDDALLIYRHFNDAFQPDLRDGCEPIIASIGAAPPVLSFTEWVGADRC